MTSRCPEAVPTWQWKEFMRLLSKMTRVLGAIALTLVTSVTFAGIITGTVQEVLVRASDGLVYVVINGTPSGQPACATHAYWMIMSETSDAGHKQYAMLLDAQATGAQVQILGAGTCTRWGDGEDIDSIDIVNQ
jgi:hypothetical protein